MGPNYSRLCVCVMTRILNSILDLKRANEEKPNVFSLSSPREHFHSSSLDKLKAFRVIIISEVNGRY